MNRITRYLDNLGKGVRVLVISLAVIFVGAGIAQATASTIGANISTTGSLSAVNASTTQSATIAGPLWVGGNATTSAAGAISTQSTLSVTGLATFLGGASTTQFTLLAGDTIKNASASSTSISGALTTTGAFTATGLATFLAGATTTQITLLAGDTIKNASASSTVISGALTTTGALNTEEFTQGGGQCTITDANGGAYVLTQAELNGCDYLYMTASGAGQEVVALTLPATSTMTTLIPDVGDYREWLIDASDLAAATTTTITTGTGIDMLAVTTAEDVIDGGEYSELRCWRKSDTDVACITSELLNSD